MTEEINELRKKKELLQKIVNKIPNMISVKDASGKFILANEAVASLYGHNAKDLLGKGDEDLPHQPWNMESCIEIDTTVMQEKQERTILEESITDSNGKKIWLQTTRQPLSDKLNDELYILGVSTNITQHRICLLYTSPSPRDQRGSRMPSSA